MEGSGGGGCESSSPAAWAPGGGCWAWRRVPQATWGAPLARGQVRAGGCPGVGAVARDQQALVGNIESAGIEGEVELLLEVATGSVLGGVRAEVGRDVLPLAGRHIDFDQAAAAAAGTIANAIDDVWILGIGRDHAELGGRHRAPVGEVHLAPVAAAADHRLRRYPAAPP